jgi:hypothetical protein
MQTMETLQPTAREWFCTGRASMRLPASAASIMNAFDIPDDTSGDGTAKGPLTELMA